MKTNRVCLKADRELKAALTERALVSTHQHLTGPAVRRPEPASCPRDEPSGVGAVALVLRRDIGAPTAERGEVRCAADGIALTEESLHSIAVLELDTT